MGESGKLLKKQLFPTDRIFFSSFNSIYLPEMIIEK